ncbi:micronuclear linker histone polyprotein [Brassica napus]|uniref:micronuclear linker histone polyprotein n=1 Tax=Brassica napus TaxID=3708 RepID=UPI002078620D|nr:micronuclear linker histone polyprotein [Brassica napus]
MAETERPHRSSSINSSSNARNASSSSSTDFFICFTSRFSSSSSMRLSSLSPARSACLTTSLSRRLRTSGSIKNASAGVLNSPMFGNSGGRKRSGSGYENGNNNNNIEPSSPKVTCIGQVRVKTRKHVKKKMRARSRRRGETSSFRRSSSDQNDRGGCRFDASENRWVHFPVTICESLRSFGSELNCFSSSSSSPCRSSCTGGSDGRRGKNNGGGCGGGGGGSSCFTRWFVAVEETGGKRREIELVVGGGEDEEAAEDGRRRSRRRHVFEGLDLSEIEMKTEERRGREDVGMINLCSPPKNALLLMRCRSDPVKVAALANRVRERQMSLDEGVCGGEEEEDEERRRFELDLEDKKRIELCEKWISGETIVEREVVSITAPEAPKEEDSEEEASKVHEEEIEAMIIKHIEDDLRNAIEEEKEEEEHVAEMEEEEEERKEEEEVAASVTVTPNVERSNQGNREPDPSPEVIMRGETMEKEKTTPYKVLPDCLLLMMCEPKLSMEVSKETWVCSTDFVRCQPGRPPAKKITEATGEHHHHHHQQPKKRIVTGVDSNASSRRRSVDKRPVHHSLLQPPRSSCSYPAAPPLLTTAASVREQKVGGGNKAYEPPVLPRCKSEPRKSASKLAPEACFWKNRKLEPHPQASVGVGGGAGVGF